MKLIQMIAESRSAIVKEWFDRLAGQYADQTTKFLKNKKNRFDNPVGYRFATGLEGLFDKIVHDSENDEYKVFLDDILRIKAVQEFAARDSVGFVFLLKDIVREKFSKEVKNNDLMDELLEFESKIDRVALIGFEIYNACREQILELRVNEVKNQSARLLQLLNKWSLNNPDASPDLSGGKVDGLT